ncbi:hypothetical protein F4779DRAFT_622648 [Xylariaceae sp. FL0662B]|nr:hypothetical protein F4779DRAFT_622648 [Xylariaceae sp. FL0662B]
MVSTRASTGNARPRVHATVSTAPERTRRTAGSTGVKKRTVGRPAKKAGAGAGVNKRAPAMHHKRKPHLADKVEGVAEKAVGKVTRKPGKKAAGTKKMRGTDGKNSRARRL